MIKPSEFQILLLALAIMPLVVWNYRSVDLPGKRWFGAAVGALLLAYILTVAEGFAAERLFNTLEHLLYAVSATCFAGAALQLRRLKQWRQ
jgi:hypothetical protein